MKRFILLFTLLFACIQLGQAQTNVVKSLSTEKSIAEDIKAGEFNFQLPAEVQKDDVALSAEYYTMYFTVNHDVESNRVQINMVENTSKARQIIVRFFVSLGIDKILIDGKTLSLEEYYASYLNKG